MICRSWCEPCLSTVYTPCLGKVSTLHAALWKAYCSLVSKFWGLKKKKMKGFIFYHTHHLACVIRHCTQTLENIHTDVARPEVTELIIHVYFFFFFFKKRFSYCWTLVSIRVCTNTHVLKFQHMFQYNIHSLSYFHILLYMHTNTET